MIASVNFNLRMSKITKIAIKIINLLEIFQHHIEFLVKLE